LTDDGFVDPDRTPNTFIADAGHHSPVIQFRWGYKASDLELQEYGASIYLNEDDYWGGGPFANGCSSLPDLWGNGLLDTLFLWIHIEHLNPLNDAMVFSARPARILCWLRCDWRSWSNRYARNRPTCRLPSCAIARAI